MLPLLLLHEVLRIILHTQVSVFCGNYTVHTHDIIAAANLFAVYIIKPSK